MRYGTYAAAVDSHAGDGDAFNGNGFEDPGNHKPVMKRWRQKCALVFADLPERPFVDQPNLRDTVAQLPYFVNALAEKRNRFS